MRCLTQLVTGKDNQTHDLGRWSWVVSMATVVAAAGWNASHGALIDLQNLATALGLVAGAHGGALWAKANTEPEAK